jgi:hypothetical protein
MNDRGSSRDRLLTDALQSYRDEYRDLSDTWRHIDSKAQGTVAVAGIFLAAVFAFVRNLVTSAPGTSEKLLLVTGVLLLVAAVILSVFALRIREVVGPPLGQQIDGQIRALLQVTDTEELDERVPRFVGDQLTMWRNANLHAHGVNKAKADLVSWAQFVLLIAMVIVSVLVVLNIVTPMLTQVS